MLPCVNELFHQNRYAALTIYLEVNSLSERSVQFAHTKECVCVAVLSGGRGSIWTLLDAEPRWCSSRWAGIVAVGYKLQSLQKQCAFIIYGPQQHGGRKNEVSGARGLYVLFCNRYSSVMVVMYRHACSRNCTLHPVMYDSVFLCHVNHVGLLYCSEYMLWWKMYHMLLLFNTWRWNKTKEAS